MNFLWFSAISFQDNFCFLSRQLFQYFLASKNHSPRLNATSQVQSETTTTNQNHEMQSIFPSSWCQKKFPIFTTQNFVQNTNMLAFFFFFTLKFSTLDSPAVRITCEFNLYYWDHVCKVILMALWAIFFVIQNIYINSNPATCFNMLCCCIQLISHLLINSIIE